jgi:hypothetical protein
MPPDWRSVAYVCRIIVGRENKRGQRRHFTRLERALKLGNLPIFLCSLSFRVFYAFLKLLLKRRQNLIAPFRVLLMLLIIVEPERRIHADKDEHQLRKPPAET